MTRTLSYLALTDECNTFERFVQLARFLFDVSDLPPVDLISAWRKYRRRIKRMRNLEKGIVTPKEAGE